MHLWLREKCFRFRNVSVIWKGFLLTLPWLGKGVLWQVGNASNIHLGVDPVVGMGSSYFLSEDLRAYLEDYGIQTLAQARNETCFASGYWFNADDLDLCGDWKFVWDQYIRGLEYSRIRLKDSRDSLLWSYNKYIGPITAAKGYESIISNSSFEMWNYVSDSLWSLNIPIKIACFNWLLIFGRILTW